MTRKVASLFMFALVWACSLSAKEAVPSAVVPKDDPELEAEIAYVEALVNRGYPDVAEPIIEATKKRWPAADARLFAIEVRGLLSMGQFEAAEKQIGALPDRKGTKYWAARLEVANSYYVRNQKAECMKIYDGFFAQFPTPPADILKFHQQADYAYGQLLAGDRQYAKAAARYEGLFAKLRRGDREWCNVGCEAADLLLKLAEEASNPKAATARAGYLDRATKIVDQLLWQLDEPVFFGRALSMKAHIEQLKGDVTKATELIDEYRQQLNELHEQMLQIDPDGKLGLLKQSPLPECLYLQAKMLFDEAQTEYKSTKRDDEKVKSYLFGPKKEGKRQVARGAFAMAQSVFLNYDTSSWAVPAGDLAEAVKKFAEEKYNAHVKTKVTPEQLAKARAAQFREANELFLSGQYAEAIAAYRAVLSRFPEREESVMAVENTAASFIELACATKDKAEREWLWLAVDASAGYLAERFAGTSSRLLMTSGGDAAVRIAQKLAESGQTARANSLYAEIIVNYCDHPNAAAIAAGKGSELAKVGRWAESLKFWQLITAHYTNSPYYASALMQQSVCAGKLGDHAAEIEYIKAYLPVEQVKIRRIQASLALAQMYQRDGLAALAGEEPVRGVEQIKRAIEQFSDFDREITAAMKDPSTPADDQKKYGELRESALFIVGECWSRLNQPESELHTYRQKAAASYETYLTAYPTGKYAKAAYVKLGTVYTALGDMEKSRNALDRLAKKFPDSDEAKNAKPRLAKNLIEMGMKREGADIYAEMLKTDGAYTAGQFASAGEALVDAKDFELANRAFEKAIKLAGSTNLAVIGRSRLGEARSAWKQGSLSEAREALDHLLKDPKLARLALAADANFMLVEIASEQGRTEKDETMRGKYFGAAIGALKKVRQYWARKPAWEQDRLDILSGDVLVNRMKAEEAMGLKDAALETCGRAASTFQVFIQAHGVTANRPIDKFAEGELTNLEEAYGKLVRLFARMGADQADRVISYGEAYLQYFPEGASRTDVINCMNQAKADLPKKAAPAQN